MFLIFDTETTGLPKNYNAPLQDFDNWPRLVQLAWQVHAADGTLIEAKSFIVKPDGFEIPFNAEQVHGISTQLALKEGTGLSGVLEEFNQSLGKAKVIIGHNIDFDLNIVKVEYLRTGIENDLGKKIRICTKEESTDYCALPGGKGGRYKWPNLTELHKKLFEESFEEAHNAAADVVATARCFLELVRLEVIPCAKLGLPAEEFEQFIKKNKSVIKPIELTIESLKEKSGALNDDEVQEETNINDIKSSFVHLHVHTQYSILDGAASIPGIMQKVKEDGMPGVAITDHGNMFGVKEFYNEAKRNGIKPIIGCEVYVARRSMQEKSDKIDASGDHLVLLARNHTGYKNLMKLVSYSYTDGMYYKPRVDKTLLRNYHEGLIASSACLGGEIPRKLMNFGVEEAEEALLEYKEIFGDDFYLELQRHKSELPLMYKEVYERQMFVNQGLTDLSKRHGIKCIATNDVHFINAEDAGAHDRLVCLSTGKDLDDTTRMQYTQQEWLKTQDEMRELFADFPEAIENTMEIFEKVEHYELNQEPIMPDFPIPEGFGNENEYLRHLTYEGAKKRYEEITDEIRERIDFELAVIERMQFPGYFLIVQDFIAAAKEMGVSVGPGRGSAAGSVVAYCTGITDIDPVKYNLLFERFLNPDRTSMPDIDIDFDEDGRDKVLQWVVNKYGEKRVAHIITFGTMAAKMAIRDVARIEKLPLSDADRLAKLVPERPGTTLTKAYKEVKELADERNSPNEIIRRTLRFAETLEGSVRHTGIHACGIIIGKNNLEENIPVCTSKDAELFVTQYDGKHVEDVGMLKMDFLGLKTLSIIKDTLENIKASRGIDVDMENLSLEDKETYELYARGDTTGLFQFESTGMKKYLRTLKPNRFEDLIAMNALYRPGPMEYIPSFVNRKHGKEKISYDLPVMEEYLKETYGITVYQEQVMLLSQKLAGFTKGQADSLRKAMGKKKKDLMNKLKVKYDEGCKENNIEEKISEKIWNDWKAFAEYAFNKSHSTCYAYVSYQTAYLKAHYPAEFMAAVLSRNINDLKKITIFMDECRRMGISVLGPDVNESHLKFRVNNEGNVRFGLGGVKGVGESAVNNIISERDANGHYKDIFDFISRVNLQTVNKKCLEALAMSGAFDNLSQMKRSRFFAIDAKGNSFIENLLRYGSRIQEEKNSAQQSLFGDTASSDLAKPVVPDAHEWSNLEKLNKEREYIGIFLSAHPLDNYKLEMETFCTHTLSDLNTDLQKYRGREITIAGIVTSLRQGLTRNNTSYLSFIIEDYTDSFNISFFGRDYISFRNYVQVDHSLLIRGSVQPRFNNENEMEFKVKSIYLLPEVRNELIRSVNIAISADSVNQEFMDEMLKLAESEKGNIYLNFKIHDADENISVDMFSRTKRIRLSDDIIHFLQETEDIKFSIN